MPIGKVALPGKPAGGDVAVLAAAVPRCMLLQSDGACRSRRRLGRALTRDLQRPYAK